MKSNYKNTIKMVLCALAVCALATLLLCPVAFAEEQTYTITFDTNGGTEIAPITARAGQIIKEPDAPTKENYIFGGWLKNGVTYSFPNRMPAESFTLTVRWLSEHEVPILGTITFNTKGGTPIKTITVAEGTAISEPEHPQKEGYKFEKWQTIYGEDFVFPDKMPAYQTDLVAIWTPDVELFSSLVQEAVSAKKISETREKLQRVDALLALWTEEECATVDMTSYNNVVADYNKLCETAQSEVDTAEKVAQSLLVSTSAITVALAAVWIFRRAAR